MIRSRTHGEHGVGGVEAHPTHVGAHQAGDRRCVELGPLGDDAARQSRREQLLDVGAHLGDRHRAAAGAAARSGAARARPPRRADARVPRRTAGSHTAPAPRGCQSRDGTPSTHRGRRSARRRRRCTRSGRGRSVARPSSTSSARSDHGSTPAARPPRYAPARSAALAVPSGDRCPSRPDRGGG